jgi:hypothetical protein
VNKPTLATRNALNLMNNSSLSMISICIPTFKRRQLLAEAVDSCLRQTYSEFEIVIGDDSPDTESEELIAGYEARYPGRFRYKHHNPSLGQNGNVNDLFSRARGSRLLLLHDDDLLLPGALEILAKLWQEHPTLDAAFGKQILIENDGRPVAQERTDNLNQGYHRIPANAGRQMTPVIAGLSRMFPNDGYLVSTELARKIGYRSQKEVGQSCDADFGIRLCAAARDVWFLDEFTMKYRITDVSVGSSSYLAPYMYNVLATLKVPPAAEPTLQRARQDVAPGAVSGFSRMGETRRAWRVFTSADYSHHRRLTPRGAYHFLLIARSLVNGKPQPKSRGAQKAARKNER